MVLDSGKIVRVQYKTRENFPRKYTDLFVDCATERMESKGQL